MADRIVLDLAPGRRLLSQAAAVTTAAMFGMTYSLSAAMIALDLARRGVSDTLIGANAGMHALGVLAIAFVLPWSVSRFGPRLLMIAALVTAALVLGALPLMPTIWLWFPLRFVMGAATDVLFVMSETWVNELSDERSRGRAMATYIASISAGFALGPLILTMVGTEGSAPYYIGAGLALAAIGLIASPRVVAPVFARGPHRNPWGYFRLAPVTAVFTALSAGVETACFSFLALYAVNLGWSEAQGTGLVSAMMVGAILLPLPIGWLGDRTDRMRLALVLSAGLGLGALLWPLALPHPILAHAAIFLWGGTLMGIYGLIITVMGSRYQGSELVGIYAVTGVTFGLGAFAGPMLTGAAMGLSMHGLPMVIGIACVAFAIFMARSRGRV